MHLGHQYAPPELYDKAVTEAAGDAFAVDDRVTEEEVPCCNPGSSGRFDP